VIDRIRLGADDAEPLVSDLEKAMEQVRKATEIISHLRTFGRAARVSIEQVDVDDVIERSLLLVHEQLRLRGIEVELELCPDELVVVANPIQLEQVFINLLTNARDALATRSARRSGSLEPRRRTDLGSLLGHGPGSRSSSSSASSTRSSPRRRSGPGTGLGPVDHLQHPQGVRGRDLRRQPPGEGATFLSSCRSRRKAPEPE
jgi:light-regulated signal transduction histidine kinase (bacteriophytochrome)